MKRIGLIVALLVLLVVVAACGGNKEAPTPEAQNSSSETTAQTAATPAQKPAEKATAAPTATSIPPTATAEPADDVMPSEEQLAALNELDSYRATVKFSSKGTNVDGDPVDQTGNIVVEYVKEPPARRMTITFTEPVTDTTQTNSMEMYQVDDQIYMYSGEEGGWITLPAADSPLDDPDLNMLTTGGIFSDVEQFDRVRPDQKINGIDSRRYKFNEKTLTKLFKEDIGEGVTADGEVWIAKEGGYVTQYTLTMNVDKSNGGVLDPTLSSGVIAMDYELSDVNKKITIELPEEALSSGSLAGFNGDFPMLKDSNVQVSSSTFIMLDTTASVTDTIKFYDDTLTEMGWSKDDNESTIMGDIASLTYIKEAVKLSLILSKDTQSGKTQVMASAEEGE